MLMHDGPAIGLGLVIAADVRSTRSVPFGAQRERVTWSPTGGWLEMLAY